MSPNVLIVTLLSGICLSVGRMPMIDPSELPQRVAILLFALACLEMGVWAFR